MFGWLVSRIWNRRKDQKRFALQLIVQAPGPNGDPVEMLSEDLSDRGVRLRSESSIIEGIVGAGSDVPLEVRLEEDLPPVKVKAKMMWSYVAAEGANVSGWQFINFHGNARRRLRHYLDRVGEEQEDWEDDAETTV